MPNEGYVRLSSKYRLRGWKGAPYTLEDRNTSKIFYLSEDAFRTLQFCSGKFPASSPIFMGVRQVILKELDRAGALEYLPEPGSLDPDQEYRCYENHHLTRVHWSMTGHCNYRCRHCYMSAPHALLPQPTTEQCLDIVDQIADCGIPRITVTGGEPLIRRDFLKIVDRMAERGLILDVIMTNGALVTEELIDALEERGFHPEFAFSYDGTQGWHNWLRGVGHAEEDLRRAAAICRKRGYVMSVETVLHKGNKHLLRETVRFLGEQGVSAVKLLPLNCTGEGEALGEYAMSGEEFNELCLEYAPQYVEDGMPVPLLTLGHVLKAFEGKISVAGVRNGEDEDCGRNPICGTARSTMYMGPDGRILPCIPMSESNVLQDYFPKIESMSLREALSDSNYMSFVSTTLDEYLGHNPKCAACEYKNRCGAGCRGKAVEANKGTDLLGVDPDACLFFTGGYYDRAVALVAELQEPARKAWDPSRSRMVG